MQVSRHLAPGLSCLGLLLALAIACTPMPVAAPAPNVAQAPVVAPEATPAAAAVAPTAQPAPAEPTVLPVAEAPAQNPGVQPTAVPPGQPAAPPVPAIQPTAQPLIETNPCERGPQQPMPAPGSPGAQDFFRSFRAPLAPAPLYSPPGQRHVGLQAGHWRNDEVPAELGRLQGGSSGGGKQEWEVALDIARRAARLLEAEGVKVDVLPATVPPRYQAHAFVSLHADGDVAGVARGFKIARPGFSSVPDVDDRLVEALNAGYAAATELPRDDEHITLRMRYYYAFNSRRFCHAVAPGVPQAIVEMGYMTSAADRRLLIGDPDRAARGIANGVRGFLNTLP